MARLNEKCKADEFVKNADMVVIMKDTRNFKTYHSRKLTDKEKLMEINAKINMMYGNELDDYDKAYIEMLSSGVTVYDIIDEI